ncbi:hypothetical protein [Rhodopirellula bahusiensis]|nr:hypothetical protein [Rhodopirellula bahusiensis]
MPNPRQAFDNHRAGPHLRSVPNLGQDDPPYERTTANELPPMMFQVRLVDGQRFSFCYSDVRQIYRRDAGRVRIDVHALAHTTIVIEGRNLDELVHCLGMPAVKWMRELDPRAPQSKDDQPEITSITVTTQAG